MQEICIVDVGSPEGTARNSGSDDLPDDESVLAEALDDPLERALEVEPAAFDENAVYDVRRKRWHCGQRRFRRVLEPRAGREARLQNPIAFGKLTVNSRG